MAAQEIKSFVVDVLPGGEGGVAIVPHAFYYFKAPGAYEAQIYKANAAGDDLHPFSTKLSGQDAIVSRSEIMPTQTLGQYSKFWLNPADGMLYVNLTPYGAEGVEQDDYVPVVNLPEGLKLGASGGLNGVSTDAARYDHAHSGVTVVAADF